MLLAAASHEKFSRLNGSAGGGQVIMLLKGNAKQVSFLHVYHHVSISCIWWAIAYAAPGGDGTQAARAELGHLCIMANMLFAPNTRMLCRSTLPLCHAMQTFLKQ